MSAESHRQKARQDRNLNRVRDFGPTDSPDDAKQTDAEFKRRLRTPRATAAIKGASGSPSEAPASVALPPPAVKPPLAGPDRFHKWAHYVIVARDHVPADGDPVAAPGYNLSGKASTIADGYAKATALAARDGQRVALYIEGSGGPWKESLVITSPGIDLVGWRQPVILGNHSVIPSITQFTARDITFTSPNTQPALLLPPVVPPVYPSLADDGLRFYGCRFSGATTACYAQRPIFAENSLFWLTAPYAATDIGKETASLVCEIDNPQTWFSWFRRCRFEAYSRGTPPGPNGMTLPVFGYAVRASARMNCVNNGPWSMQMTSADGILRTAVNAYTGQGAVTTGLILEDCGVNGSLLCEGWFVSHLGGWQRGGIPFPSEAGNMYAILRGRDWLLGEVDRQFGMVQFDSAKCFSTVIAASQNDPLIANPIYPGGTAVWFRNSAHLVPGGIGAPALAHHARGSGIDTFLETRSSSAAAAWTSGGLAAADGINIGTLITWHPLSL